MICSQCQKQLTDKGEEFNFPFFKEVVNITGKKYKELTPEEKAEVRNKINVPMFKPHVCAGVKEPPKPAKKSVKTVTLDDILAKIEEAKALALAMKEEQ